MSLRFQPVHSGPRHGGIRSVIQKSSPRFGQQRQHENCPYPLIYPIDTSFLTDIFSFPQTTGNDTITLAGALEPHNSSSELSIVSELFTNYLNGVPSDVIATGKSTLQSDGTEIAWLSSGLSALSLHVPFTSLAGALNPIQSISIGDLALAFASLGFWHELFMQMLLGLFWMIVLT